MQPLKPRPFFYLCLMQQLLSVICANSTWGQRLMELLENGFPKFPDGLLSVNDMGLVAGWKENAPWKKQIHKREPTRTQSAEASGILR